MESGLLGYQLRMSRLSLRWCIWTTSGEVTPLEFEKMQRIWAFVWKKCITCSTPPHHHKKKKKKKKNNNNNYNNNNNNTNNNNCGCWISLECRPHLAFYPILQQFADELYVFSLMMMCNPWIIIVIAWCSSMHACCAVLPLGKLQQYWILNVNNTWRWILNKTSIFIFPRPPIDLVLMSRCVTVQLWAPLQFATCWVDKCLRLAFP